MARHTRNRRRERVKHHHSEPDLEDTFDCFPAWDRRPTALWAPGTAQYDPSRCETADHVWIDHNTVREIGGLRTQTQPYVFGVLYQVHDGELDITNASDLVTVSYNRFQDHDKVDADRLVGRRQRRPRQADA